MIIERPIGLFDSGMGGLTVVRAVQDLMPAENLIYLGDMGRLPYGTKSVDTVRLYSLQLVRFLLRYNIKLLIIACNTATISAMSYIKQLFPKLVVLGVIEPCAREAIQKTKNNKVSVLATSTTVSTGAYTQMIRLLSPHTAVFAKACNLLVSIAEEGWQDKQFVAQLLDEYFLDEALLSCDTVVLGCTHFPIFTDLIQERWPGQITVVNSALATARSAYDILAAKGLLNNAINHGSRYYYVTDSPCRFAEFGPAFLGKAIDGNVELIDPLGFETKSSYIPDSLIYTQCG